MKFKLNKKGFMLVESIIVTVVVVTIMTSLYIVFNRVYNNYTKKSTYTNIDGVYALKEIMDFMINTETTNSFMFNDLINNNTNYTEITCDTSNASFNDFCNTLVNEHNINNNKIYLVSNNNISLNNLKENVENQTFKDYIDYLMNIGIHSVNFLGNNTKYTHILLLEISYNNINKYAYLPLNKEVSY